MEIQLVGTIDTYAVTELPFFHSTIDKQVILGSICLRVNKCDIALIEYLPNTVEKFILLVHLYCCVTDVFIAEKFVLIFSCFYK